MAILASESLQLTHSDESNGYKKQPPDFGWLFLILG